MHERERVRQRDILSGKETRQAPEFDLAAQLLEEIRKHGGFVNTHAHMDRANTINNANLELADATLEQKWALVDQGKRDATVEVIAERMSAVVEDLLDQGVQVAGSFIDVDEVIQDKAIRAAEIVKAQYKGDIKLLFANQTLKGVVSPESRYWFDMGAEYVDIIGALPKKDKGHEDEHLDIVMETALRYGKMVHAHVDQNNDPNERETEQLIKKTREHGMEGAVMGIHGISIAAQPREYRHWLYGQMAEVGMGMISCPTAWIDSRRTEVLTPTHNSITPAEEMLQYGIPVGIGTDNIRDIYKPFTTPDMWTQLYVMLESLHHYDQRSLMEVATRHGRTVLGVA